MWVLSFSGGMTAPALLQGLLQLEMANLQNVLQFFQHNTATFPFFQRYLKGVSAKENSGLLLSLSGELENEAFVELRDLKLPEATSFRLFTDIFHIADEKVLAPFQLFVYLSILILLDKYSTANNLLFFFPEVDVNSSSQTFNILKEFKFKLSRGIRPLQPLLAALLKKFSALFIEKPTLRLKNFQEIPDPLGQGIRIRIFESENPTASIMQDTVSVLETNIDDTTPEIIASAMQQVLRTGALDYVVIPVGMKKSRMGFQIQVLCPPEKSSEVIRCLFKWTSTFGVRQTLVRRYILERSCEEVETSLGRIRIKKGYLEGKAIRISPEFDDIVKISRMTGNSTQNIYNIICKELKIRRD